MSPDAAIAALLVTTGFLGFMVYNQNRSLTRLQTRFDAVAFDRDGWRDVAQRALRVAQIGRGVNERAARIAESVVPKYE